MTIYDNLGKFDNDLTVRPSPGNDGLFLGNHPLFLAELFRLVNYYNLPRWIWKDDLIKMDLPSGRQTWLAGKWTIFMGDFQSYKPPFSFGIFQPAICKGDFHMKASIQFGDFRHV